jgi:serine/threonine-protein kinase
MDPTHISESSGEYLAYGAELGNYRVLKFLSEGGMGQVYVVEHPTLHRKAAAKLLRSELSSNADEVRRFLQEGRVVNAIQNPHIVDVFDLGQDSHDHVYQIMELLEGGTLADVRAAQGPFSVARAVKIGEQVVGALKAAHDHGVIHRDVKPDNVFLCKRGTNGDFVKLLDFGIAKLIEGSSIQITRAGIIVGSPEYMSPEQAAGGSVDFRTDIYQAGLLLYWMLADRLPFDARDAATTMRDRVTKQPRLLPPRSTTGEGIPHGLAALIGDCLATDPDARPGSMHQVAVRLADLDAPLASVRDSSRASTEKLEVVREPVPDPVPEVVTEVVTEEVRDAPSSRAPRLWLLLVGAGLGALVGLVLWLGFRGPPRSSRRAATAPTAAPPAQAVPALDPVPTLGAAPTGPASRR